ncbi:hypothetical protein JX265_001781 [Neoarthrinium moseri]|uniref:Uncharacterized protein n=1 Tax=Neoarthrinium moseri TaxID=1658444 RepID=A0A9P9WVS4_9PEZI|nr:hypothetical protein JX265_001781 [Neoarthrinium moseri]
MASEIHRRRTGRGLKVTEEIVIKEEMYEEEEDDLPRQFRYLTQHLQTNSPAMNQRVNAYVTTQAAMATMARYNEVNRLFSESFPTAAAYQQQLNSSVYMTPLMDNNNNNAQFSPTSPTMPSPTTHGDSSVFGMDRRISTATNASSTTTARGTSVSSPPALSPGSATLETPESRATPYQAPAQAFPNFDPQLNQNTSSFTSELPNEIKMLGMANVDPSDPMAPFFFGGNPSAYQMFGQHPERTKPELSLHTSTIPEPAGDLASPQDSLEPFDESLFSPVESFTGHFDNFSTMGTPAGGLNENTWDNLIDFGSEQ